ncbi:MAG: thiol oxidoreductase [Bacteroidetes bacterium]|nr:thiol oxidoreductase [Bacteroidota bacterium]MDA1121817.1 thiol oxidoreductase [Bacteroidota bacterium]
MQGRIWQHFLNILLLSGLAACQSFLPDLPEENELLDGPEEGLSTEEQGIFLAGDIAFNDEIFTPATGLGPIFVASSCASCHVGDGKGHPTNALTRFSQTASNEIVNRLLDKGGPQLQHRSIPGFTAEQIPPEANGVSKVVAPAVTGLGFLAAIPDQTILDLVVQQRDEGIVSGEVQWVDVPGYLKPEPWQITNSEAQYIGRFGKKSAAISILQQVVGAYKQDMGVTTDFDTEDPINFSLSANQIDPTIDPEIPASTVNGVVFYIRTLKRPLPRNQDEPSVIAGKSLFSQIQCSSCHLPVLKTGLSDISILSEQEFYPYTDMLLHDMGPELDDGHVDGNELSFEWRTPPLWGLGLAPDSQGGQFFLMHDGRATSIEEAILLHGGESESMKESFEALDRDKKNQIIEFLESL